jgi:uncharacterized protein (DUF433 family)
MPLGGNLMDEKVNWTLCGAVEKVPGKLSGQPVIRHSRVRPGDLVANRDQGAEWLAENYGLPIETVKAVLAFYDAHRKTRVPHPV